MRLKQKMRTGVSRVARAVLAGVLVVGLAPSVAFADLTAGSGDTPGVPTAMSVDGYVKAAAHAAANPAPEILGLNNPNQRSDDEGNQTYNFFGDAEINTNPDPYLYNGHNNLTPKWFLGGRTSRAPEAGLKAYDTSDPSAEQNAVWKEKPEVILGTGSLTIPDNEHDFYAETARDVETAMGLEANSYNPVGVTYNRTNLPTMIQTMYRLAAAANEAIDNSGNTLQTRYGNPMEIAQDYERYILGQKGLVKQAIDTGKVTKKTVALVESADETAGTYTIITDGVAEGTATTNRYLEAVQGVTNNYYDTVGEEGATSVTAAMLAENVDLIILGTASGTDNTTGIMGQLTKDALLDRTYYCVNWANGSSFGTTVNSVENAQNVGRILPCVYPEVLDQSDMIAYYYETFYHLKTGVVASIMAERMDGVRNWAKTDSASYTSWEETDYEGYNHDAVQAQLIAGVGYLNAAAAGEEVPEAYITPSTNVSEDVVATEDVTASAITITGVEASYAYTGSAITPEPVVKDGETTLVKGKDYLVSYANNINIGTATMTVTGISKYAGVVTFNFEIAPLGDVSDANVKKFDDEYAYTGDEISIKPSVTVAGKKLTQGTDFEVVIQQNGKDVEFKEMGTYDVTIKGIGGYIGSQSKQIKIVTYFTVYLQKGTAKAEAVKSYGGPSDFAALASDSSDPVSALFFKNNAWNVATAVTYVTLADLLADAGISDQWASGATISYGQSNFTYDQIQAMNKFFPDAKLGTSGTETAAKDAPFVFSLTEYSDVTTADKDANAVETANIAAANKASTPRTIFGITEADYKNPTADGAQVAGQRLWSNVSSITIKVPAADVTDTVSVTPKKASYTYTGKAIEDPLVVKVGETTLVKDTDYTVTYSNNVNAGTAKADVTLIGAYTGTAPSATYTIAKATVTAPAAKTGLVYNGKAQTGVAAGKGYTIKGNTATNAGSYTATLTVADANHAFKDGKSTATVSWSIAKAANPLKIAKATRNAKFKKAKTKKGQTVKGANISVKGQGTVTYSITKVLLGKKKVKKFKNKFTINKAGKIKAKKLAKKGTYKVYVKAVTKGNANYNGVTKTAVVTIKVK